MNGSRYDQIRSAGVCQTYITIIEGINKLYWLKDGICVIPLPTLYPQFPNLSQYNTSKCINEIPKHANG